MPATLATGAILSDFFPLSSTVKLTARSQLLFAHLLGAILAQLTVESFLLVEYERVSDVGS
jgi:hypothetical protein